jgi:LytS/YehU family sensor histidine kinase
MLNHLSDFLRYSLQKSNADLISLREELKNMNRYLEIEKVRFGSRLICETELDKLCLDMKLPAMILQPIYENAIKHGLYESIEPVTIGTSCKLKNGNLEISIINNYDPEAIAPKGERLGLENVSNTLRNIYNQDQLLTITRENNHFEVSLIIPQLLTDGESANL